MSWETAKQHLEDIFQVSSQYLAATIVLGIPTISLYKFMVDSFHFLLIVVRKDY